MPIMDMELAGGIGICYRCIRNIEKLERVNITYMYILHIIICMVFERVPVEGIVYEIQMPTKGMCSYFFF